MKKQPENKKLLLMRHAEVDYITQTKLHRLSIAIIPFKSYSHAAVDMQMQSFARLQIPHT